MKNRKLLKKLEKEIACYVAENSDRDIKGFVSRVLAYIRGNLKLLGDKHYDYLYFECLFLLKWLNRKLLKKKKHHRTEYIEMVTDIMNTHKDYPFSEEIVSKYLQFRISVWETGAYDKFKVNIPH